MLILASGSPRRKHLLESMGASFQIVSADVEEMNHLPEPKELVETNARLKTDWVAAQRPSEWVLGSDTTVALGNEILNKPVDLEDARGMLRRMSGNTHTVYTAVCLMKKDLGLEELFTVTSEVSFLTFDDDQITEYFKVVNPLDKAGAYGIQEGKEMIIEEWKGSFSNIMGLPVDEVKELLEKHGLL
ncbi:MAG: Maf family protein [Opitutales bacterium]|jgi:septum formation protein|nr:Maf family protein [Opitutales bacterium]